jgi:hypothetical protein
MKNTRIAFATFISGTCASANKYKGDKKTEKGSRNSLIVEAVSTNLFYCKLSRVPLLVEKFTRPRGKATGACAKKACKPLGYRAGNIIELLI